MQKERELTMSYRTILSLAAATVLGAAGILTISTDALARVGVHRGVGVYHGGVAHRTVYRGTYARRGIYRGAYVRPGVVAGVGAAALGAAAVGAAASAYNYNNGYGPSYNGNTGYYYRQYEQPPYGYYPYRNWREF